MSCSEEITTVYKGNDHTINLSDVLSGTSYINSADVTFQIYDSEDEEVSGASGTLTIDGTGGDYEGTIDVSVIDLLTVGEEYRIQVSGEQTSGDYEFEFNDRIIVQRRGKT